MGLDCNAIIAIGEKLEIVEWNWEEQRFDEKTGKKYYKNFQKNIYIINEDRFFGLTDHCYYVDAIPPEEEYTILLRDCENKDNAIFGKILFETDSHRNCENFTEIELKTIEKEMKQYEKIFKRRPAIFLYNGLFY